MIQFEHGHASQFVANATLTPSTSDCGDSCISILGSVARVFKKLRLYININPSPVALLFILNSSVLNIYLLSAMKILPLLYLSVASAASISGRTIDPRVTGHGVTYIGIEDNQYGVEKWLGIRYSEAPVGPLRLQPAVSFNNRGIVNSQKFGSACFNLGANHTGQSEDCLFVNVYRPTPRHSQKRTGLPVMVWIHGGGFNTGAGSIYKAESLVQRSCDVHSPTIVVTMNYRLSFFGFSGMNNLYNSSGTSSNNTPAGKVSEDNNALNLGLRDQREALNWVNKNIHLWGGDKEKVTIFGQSAGATSIGLQITAFGGKTEGLFRAAILESGSPADTSPTPPPTFAKFQEGWDAVVKAIG